ncbi:aldehyde dehydrogenase (NAD) family protein [Bacteriovorax sp. BSW11_IV]|uniref:coniferyl aldehyde dehydrogenase n=1 Tax=Bacteriovorax sp. BSW11_IV TaxID=1353529 RepID=UPI00038A4088|nr:coniferyl aldehyde dehydrogenase [Bacteriovorax sp. BSW11_IV]EQC42950.1 aldehyde dehydrogenase (NAD) family protein [Bacteriovorax sp. BSW11_IV]
MKNYTITNLQDVFSTQRQVFRNNPYPTREFRKEQLKKLKRLILENKKEIIQAMSDDFGYRSEYDSLFGDIVPTVNNINYCIKHLGKWMKTERRSPGLALFPAKIEVMYQPKGVVGIIVPWNFPIMLSLAPLANALAAGNRVIIKMSELSVNLTNVLDKLFRKYFSENEVLIYGGDAAIAEAFTRLPFDHILFTGSTRVGKMVMKACSENLTPVTLELGGKSPVIIDDKIDMEMAVERVIFGKSLNAGQICVAPDYILIPENRVTDFCDTYKKQFLSMYKKLDNDFTHIINEGHYERISKWKDEAKNNGALILDIDSDSSQNRRMTTKLILNAQEDDQVLKEEIFGPLLPIVPYHTIDEAIKYVNSRPRPLALYLMSMDRHLQKRVLKEIHSGGVGLNETLMQVAADDAPFGGIGPSGLGHYHGKEGFLTFSHAKTIIKRGKYFNTTKLLYPPYGTFIQRFILKFFLR